MMMGLYLLGTITLTCMCITQVCGTSPKNHHLGTRIQEHHLGTSQRETDQAKKEVSSVGSTLLQNFTIKKTQNTKKHLQPVRLLKRALGDIAKLTTGDSLPAGQELASIPCPTDKCICTKDQVTMGYTLYCRFKHLNQIPKFSSVNTLFYQAIFSKNNITELPSNAFSNIKVERLDLQENKIGVIQPGAFSGVEPYLTELFIDGDLLKPMPFDKIENLVKLRRLQFRKFAQTEISSNNHFDRFPDLEELVMIKIKGLQNINSLAFKGKLQKLQKLHIEETSLNNIPVESLQDLISLRTLEFRDCQISEIYSRTFSELKGITHIDLYRNKITQINHDAFIGISNQIEFLDLSFNEIGSDSLLSISSKNWARLQTLKLEYNQIEFFHEKAFSNMPNLQYLHLTEVHLTKVTYGLFQGLSNLHTLDLSYNKIARVESGALRDMKKLSELRLNHQFYIYGRDTPLSLSLELTDSAFSGLSDSLSILNLEWTPIKSDQLWKNLNNLTKLSELNLKKVRLQNIPEYAFSKFKTMEKVHLNFNQLTDIPQTAFTGLENSLETVSLDNNELTTLSECTFRNFTKLSTLNLLNNKWNCDCRLRWLHELISKRTLTYPQCICVEPARYNGMNLIDIPASSLTCNGVGPEPCKILTTPEPSVTTVKPSETTARPSSNQLKLTVAGATERSLTLVISNADFPDISGFKMEYFATANDNTKQEMKIHKDAVVQTIHGLQPGTFYTVCVIPEINYQHDPTKKACRTTQTLAIPNDNEGQKDEVIDSSQNIVIGVTLAAFVVVILIIIGVYSIVKYKVQKLKTIQMSLGMAPPHIRHGNGEGFCLDDEECKIYTTGNVYTDVRNARIANQYQICSPRQMQRQCAVEDKLADSQSVTYAKVNKKQRHKAVDESVKEQAMVRSHDHEEDSNDPDKHDLAERHSAPSRLNVLDLTKASTDRNSRPLPATPEELKGGLKFKGKPKSGGSSKKIVTQASVYEHNLNKSTDPIYHEIDSDENS